MVACQNAEAQCTRRFCAHCLTHHLGEVHPASDGYTHGEVCDLPRIASSLVQDRKNLDIPPDSDFRCNNVQERWRCPSCRGSCCCSFEQCQNNHRHCKAYRYRKRRAELSKRKDCIGVNEKTVAPNKRRRSLLGGAGVLCKVTGNAKTRRPAAAKQHEPSAASCTVSHRPSKNEGLDIHDPEGLCQRHMPHEDEIRKEEVAEEEHIPDLSQEPLWMHLPALEDSDGLSSPESTSVGFKDGTSEDEEVFWPAQEIEEEPEVRLDWPIPSSLMHLEPAVVLVCDEP